MSWPAGSPTSGGAWADGHRGRCPRHIRRSRKFARRVAAPAHSGGATMSLKKFGIGQAATRKEDDPILRGGGRYVADHAPEGALHAVVLRSPHAHARFRITDVATARGMKGVRCVLTAEEVADLGPLPCE